MTDDPIKQALDRIASSQPAPDDIRRRFAEMAPSLRRARRAHQMRVAAASIAGVILIGGAGIYVGEVTGSDPEGVPFADLADDADETRDAAEEDAPQIPIEEDPGYLQPPEEDDSEPGQPTDVGTEAAVPSTTEPTTTEPTTTEAADPPATSTVTATTHEESTPGGSVTIEFSDGKLVLLDVSPADGFEAEIDKERPDEIEVTFEADDVSWEIEFKIDDGELTVSIDSDDSE